MSKQSDDMDENNELEFQLERSGYFTHSSLSRQSERINEIERHLYGLIELLMEKKVVTQEEVVSRVAKIQKEITENKKFFHPVLALRVDDQQQVVEPEINCAERLHICNAICCKLSFALSSEEVEKGEIKWDLGRPYYIRPKKNGYCTHFSDENSCCSKYHNRPKVCRSYSCKNDSRIWKDFEQMILNEEWIKQNLTNTNGKTVDLHMMKPIEDIT